MVTRFSLGLLWIVQIFLLIMYVNKTNRNLLLFLQSFEFEDDTLTFNKSKNLPFKPLYHEFNRIIDNFRKVKLDKEIEHQYFQYSIKHVDTGLISFDQNGNVEVLNEAAKRLLGLEFIQNIEALDRVKRDLTRQCKELKPGEQGLVKLIRKNQILSLSMRAAEFKIEHKHIKLISFQNIKNELDEQELDSWQKLIRVLTHEIINSVSPITLLSSTLVKMFDDGGKPKKKSDLDEEQISNTFSGLQAIRKRSKGLSRFVESYKSLTKIPDPVISEVQLAKLLPDMLMLFQKTTGKQMVEIDYKIQPKNLAIHADEKLIEQVLINLIKNAIEAGEDTENLKIKIEAKEESGKVKIEIIDNGPGISSDVIENIFIPFYTTKREGSGIGLSLSRQILRKHGGNLEVISSEGKGANFIVTL